MEHSLTREFNRGYDAENRSLNPCSNGTLSDKLKESALDFSCFLIPGHNPVSVRELVPSGRNFRKCMRNYSSFQIKTIVYLLNLLKSNGLHFRK